MQCNKPLSLISAIIPARNEAARIANLIASLRAMPEVGEIIVSDGDSDDSTIEIARDAGAKVLCGARGRGAQLNLGAHATTGQVLWFLHADAKVHRNSGHDITHAIQNPRVLGGNFRLTFDTDSHFSRFCGQIARWQRRCGIFYGDSGIWVTRDAWQELGGFESWPLFEDYDFARRLNHLAHSKNAPLKYFHRPIVASSRRFNQHPWRTLGLWLLLQTLFSCGVAPDKLAQIYRATK